MKFKLKKIDWQNHIVGFIATIIGIIIGLNLDERQKNNETHQRLTDFTKLIQEEINFNVGELDTFLNNSFNNELHLKFLIERDIDENIITCTQAQLDSVAKVEFPHPFIITTEKVGENRFKVYFALTTFSYSPQSTVWEAFRNTDLINNFDAKEITRLTRLYKDFTELQRAIEDVHLKTTSLIDRRQSDPSLRSLPLQEYLNRLVELSYHVNSTVDDHLAYMKPYNGISHLTKYPQMTLETIRESKATFK